MTFLVFCIFVAVLLIAHELNAIKVALTDKSARSYREVVESIKTPKPEREHKEREIRHITSRKNKVTTPIGVRSQVQDELVSLDQMPMEDLFNSIDENGRLKEG